MSRRTHAASGELNPLATQRAAAALCGVQKMRLEAGELVVAPEREWTPRSLMAIIDGAESARWACEWAPKTPSTTYIEGQRTPVAPLLLVDRPGDEIRPPVRGDYGRDHGGRIAGDAGARQARPSPAKEATVNPMRPTPPPHGNLKNRRHARHAGKGEARAERATRARVRAKTGRNVNIKTTTRARLPGRSRAGHIRNGPIKTSPETTPATATNNGRATSGGRLSARDSAASPAAHEKGEVSDSDRKKIRLAPRRPTGDDIILL